MFSRPSDVPPALPPVRNSEHVMALHAEWSRIHAAAAPAAPWRRLARRGRAYANRALGRTDRELIADLIRAVDAVAARCDELSERLTSQHVTLDEVATAYGEELTRLRADLAHLREGASVRWPRFSDDDG